MSIVNCTEETTLPLNAAARVAALAQKYQIPLDAAMRAAAVHRNVPTISPMREHGNASRRKTTAEINPLRTAMNTLFMASIEAYNSRPQLPMSEEVRRALTKLNDYNLTTTQSWSALSQAVNFIEASPVSHDTDKIMDALHDAMMLLAAHRRQYS